MDAAIYHLMQQVEDEHWWFVGRRNIVRDAIVSVARLTSKKEPLRILDAGCGTGGNLPMLAEFGRVSGMEFDPSAAEMARARGPWCVEGGSLPAEVPFADEKFDLVSLTDVLEHIDDDRAALMSLGARLSPSGRLLITVPAFQFLWSAHDTWHHHKRRYTAASLRQVIESAGLEVERISYFNFWLFPVVACVRLAGRLLHRGTGAEGLAVPSKLVNTFLTDLFSSERMLLRMIPLPFGVSILAIAHAPSA